MPKQKKKHSYVDRLSYMHMIEDGFSVRSISTRYGIDHILLSSLWTQYQKEGRPALDKKSYSSLSLTMKMRAIDDYVPLALNGYRS